MCLIIMVNTLRKRRQITRRGHCLALPLVTPKDEAKTGNKDENNEEQNECKAFINWKKKWRGTEEKHKEVETYKKPVKIVQVILHKYKGSEM